LKATVYLAKVLVTLRPSILDPQGKAVQHAIGTLKVGRVSDVRMGKYIELKIEADSEAAAKKTAEEVCKKLLANPVMEDFSFELMKAG
jgi:phosphoribosylformylglycinamidine synthase PurS subunit